MQQQEQFSALKAETEARAQATANEARSRAVGRLQRWWRRRTLRSRWLELVEDLMGYAQLMRQLRQGREAKRLQRWWRHRLLRVQWLFLIDHLTVNAALRRKQRVTNAVLRLQAWYRRRVLRQHWLRVVEEARVRREMRALLLEHNRREAAQRNWYAALLQARYRGNVGRWLARARSQVDLNTYGELVHRREQMLIRHKKQMAIRRENAAEHIQRWFRRQLIREKMRFQVRAVQRLQACFRHLRTRRRWQTLLSEVSTYSMMAGRRAAMLKRLQAQGKLKNAVPTDVPMPRAKDAGLDVGAMAAAVVRLQRWWRHVRARRRWMVVLRDLQAYAEMVGRREAVLRRLREAGQSVTAQRQKTNQLLHAAQEGLKKRVFTRREAVSFLQRWWRHKLLQLHWLSLIEHLTVNAALRRKQRVTDAVLRLQAWYRRRVLRGHWLRIVEEARVRRELRALVLEHNKRQAAMQNWYAALLQARYRGNVGRWLVRARQQLGTRAYTEMIARRQRMLEQHAARVAQRQTQAATLIQRWLRRIRLGGAWRRVLTDAREFGAFLQNVRRDLAAKQRHVHIDEPSDSKWKHKSAHHSTRRSHWQGSKRKRKQDDTVSLYRELPADSAVRSLTDGTATTKQLIACILLQQTWRRTVIRVRWHELVEYLSVNAALRRKQRVTNAVLRLQAWYRRRVLRQHWLRVVEEARVRREMRALLLEHNRREAAQRNWYAALLQARYRGNVGRWLARARSQVDLNTYGELVHRREQMLIRHKKQMAIRRENAAEHIQRWFRRQLIREKMRFQVRAVQRLQACFRHLRTRRRWQTLLSEVSTYSMMAGRRAAMLKRLQAQGKLKNAVPTDVPMPRAKDAGLDVGAMAAAVVRLQRWWRHVRARRRWMVVLRDLQAYAEMVGRREAVLRRLREAGQSVTAQRQKTNQLLHAAQEGLKKRVFTRREAVSFLQRWWRHKLLQLHWLSLIEHLTVNAALRRKQRVTDAVLRLQAWYRRRVLREQWLKIVLLARARRQLYEEDTFNVMADRREAMLQRAQEAKETPEKKKSPRSMQRVQHPAIPLSFVAGTSTCSILGHDAAMQGAASQMQAAYRAQVSRRSTGTSKSISSSVTKSPGCSAISGSQCTTPALTVSQTPTPAVGKRPLPRLPARPVRAASAATLVMVPSASKSTDAKTNSVPLFEATTGVLADATPADVGGQAEARRMAEDLAAVRARREAETAKRLASQKEQRDKEAASARRTADDAARQEAWEQVQIASRQAAEEKAARIAVEEAARVELARMARQHEKERAARLVAEERAASRAPHEMAVRVAVENEVARMAAVDKAARLAAEEQTAQLRAELEALRLGSLSHSTPLAPDYSPSAAPDRSEATAMTLQRWWRRRTLRSRWLELVEDLMGYAQLMRQLRQGREAKRLQSWWRRRVLRSRWLELVEDLVGYARLRDQLRQAAALKARKQLEDAAAVTIGRHARGLLATEHTRRLLERRDELRDLARQYDRLIEDVRVQVAKLREQRADEAAVTLQRHARGMLARELAWQMYQKHQQLLADLREYDVLIAEVRQACFWLRMRRQQDAARCIQADARGWLARQELQRRRMARKELRLLAAAYDTLIAAVHRAVQQQLEARSIRRERAAMRLQSFQRGRSTRARHAHANTLEQTRSRGLFDLVQYANELTRRAEQSPPNKWGFVQFGGTLARSELDELQLEAAADHAFLAHELGVPVTDASGRTAIRPLLIFDSHVSSEPHEREQKFPLNLTTAYGRRRAILRHEMRGLTIDRETREVLSRPLHQMWGLGERTELRLTEEEWLLHRTSDHGVTLVEKLEGEMVHFWQLDGRLHAATRAGRTPVATRVEEHVMRQPTDYAGFAHCALRAALTPVFVWCPATTSHERSRLVLVALRSMSNGLYLPYAKLERIARRFRLPVVAKLAHWSPKPGRSFEEALSQLREVARRTMDDPSRPSPPSLDREHALVSMENGFMAKLALAQPIIRLAATGERVAATPARALELATPLIVAHSQSSALLDEWRELRATTDQLERQPDITREVGLERDGFDEISTDSPRPASTALQVEITLRMEGDLDDLQRLGGGALCDAMADEMGIASERLELRAARLVRPGLRLASGEATALAPCVEVILEVLTMAGVTARGVENESGGPTAPPAAVAAAALLGSSRRRLSARLGLSLLQLPSVHTELPIIMRTHRSTNTAYSSGSHEPRQSDDASSWTQDATGHVFELSRPQPTPAKALDPAELGGAMRIVHRFARERMGVALPPKPPSILEVIANSAAQAQLLQLLQAVLMAAERLPVEGTWAYERPSLVGAASMLVLALQRQTVGFNASPTLDGALAPAPSTRGLPSIGNRALAALAHVGRAVDDSAASLTEAISVATSEARQRAWAGAARPEPYHVRTFVRLRPPSTFELLWARRSKRIAWGTKHADVRSPVAASPARHASPAHHASPGGAGVPPMRVELSEVFEPGAPQSKLYNQAIEPLVSGVLGGLDCAVVCVGATGTGKTYTLYGTEAARSDPIGVPREEWGAVMRACEAFMQRAVPQSVGGPAAFAAAASTACVHMSFIEIDGEDCCDLLRGGASLSGETDDAQTAPRAIGATQLRLHSLEDVAYALRLGLRTSNRGALAARTHTMLTLSVRAAFDDANGVAATPGAPGAGWSTGATDRDARLVLVDLASGELHGPQRYLSPGQRYLSPGQPQSKAGRSLAVLGACVAARAEGALRGVPWAESRLSLMLREALSGEFCTAIIGCCGAAEADTAGTISTLHFLRHAGRLVNRVRVPQPPLESLLRRLRAIAERLALQQQGWLERRPPVLTSGGSNGMAPAADDLAILPATGGAEDLGPQQEALWYRELGSQLGMVTQLRDEQVAILRAHARDLKAAVNEAGRQRRCLPWSDEGTGRGLSGAHDVMQKIELADQLVSANEDWLREAQEACSALLHAASLRAPILHAGEFGDV